MEASLGGASGPDRAGPAPAQYGPGMSRSAKIEAFLQSGRPPVDWLHWTGGPSEGAAALRRLLVRIVQHRGARAPLARRQPPDDPVAVVWARVEGMAHGLLGPEGAARLAAALPGCLRVVTMEELAGQLDELSLDDGWCLCNILLEDMGAPPLSDDAPQLDGLCSGGRIWVPPGAFSPPSDRVDVLVHEVAHLLHSPAGAGSVVSQDGPLINVPGDQYETFAYACELWACLRDRESAAVDRVARETAMTDPRVDEARLALALHAAATGGWLALRDAVVAGAPTGRAAQP